MTSSTDGAALPRWGFDEPGALRDKLTALALAGTKTTTASLVADYQIGGASPAVAGERQFLIDSDDRPVAIVETLEVRIVRLADVDDQHAIDEGEGYVDAHDFRVDHGRYWNAHLETIRTGLGDATFEITEDTLVVLERFRVVEPINSGP